MQKDHICTLTLISVNYINNWRFPEITGEIIRKSEAPAVGHHFRYGLQAYIGPWFQDGGSWQKALVCDSIRPSGMDLYYTGLPDARYALETFLFSSSFSRVLRSFWRGYMRCVRLEWQTDWIDCERPLFTPCSLLRRRNVKKKIKKIIGSLCCIFRSASWLTRSRSLRAEDRIQNQE